MSTSSLIQSLSPDSQALARRRFGEMNGGLVEPTSLVLPELIAFDYDRKAISATPGLHVVLGHNNSGKTRLLDALSRAQLECEFRCTSLPQDMRHQLASRFSDQLNDLPSLRAVWGRNHADADPKQDLFFDTFSVAIADERWHGQHMASPVLMSGLSDFLSSRVVLRPAVLVPTNRFIPDEAALATVTNITEVSSFIAMLETLKRDYETESIFDRIAAAFEDVTEGLKIEFRGVGGASILHIREHGGRPRRLSECGDGLRDLIVLIAYARIFANHDLMVDEPGLRLHPHAQRRLLRYLEQSIRNRAIWIASHDGVFVGAYGVRSRYSVQRDQSTHASQLKQLPTQEELRNAYHELGWEPQDALLADFVLYCEGPADKIIFEAVVRRLAAQDATFAGVVVVSLGGDGAVWGSSPTVASSVEFLRRVAPHAHHAVILDPGDKNETARNKLKKELADRGVLVEFLKCNELENYFLSAPLITDLAKQAAAAWQKYSDQPIGNVPLEGSIAADLTRRDVINEKGSEILNSIFTAAFGRKIKKPEVAQWAVPLMETHAKELLLSLIDEVRRVLTARLQPSD